ncbi:hypothetical protein PTSG_00246 [Salpingoeca rosetta]|uniref:Maspardin n=1 Tax=Salpingoeca rosetta (strain ATCC 50818 / BSB-021) TaxID=946362 RepID=F2TVX9_SALR5|nr:uncharacterized protein PTSG_00246 [Salpingoeca rosetta]EGD72225.1 hypothetical protein PTSG_00246 [Salpingoeca rosetta]|eukprot:XP_004998796.1 hypothetical protein PTSG_00246 [Salpingoeca rosetta]
MMEERSSIASSAEYQSFRSTVPKRRVDVDYMGKEYTWKIFDYGPKTTPAPVLFFPPVTGTADVYFQQLISLTGEGYRCISMDYPVTWSIDEFVGVTLTFLQQFGLNKVHIVGASLGAFLAQKLAELTKEYRLVQSLTLINGFTDTAAFKSAPSALVVQFLPGFMLKRMLMQNFPQGRLHTDVANSIDFIVEQLETLTQPELASRLNLNIKPSYVDPRPILDQHIPVMIVEVQDKCAISSNVRLEMLKYYPDARIAHLKHGGNFPYLAVSSEVDMFIKIHLRQFYGTPASPTSDSELNDMFKKQASGAATAEASDSEQTASHAASPPAHKQRQERAPADAKPVKSRGMFDSDDDDDDDNEDDETF